MCKIEQIVFLGESEIGTDLDTLISLIIVQSLILHAWCL